ncbi:Ribonuclease/ribotoxin [Gyrodon lividus]|nr:Ribonuclease/ribotoxin [Gyrodon lividus]
MYMSTDLEHAAEASKRDLLPLRWRVREQKRAIHGLLRCAVYWTWKYDRKPYFSAVELADQRVYIAQRVVPESPSSSGAFNRNLPCNLCCKYAMLSAKHLVYLALVLPALAIPSPAPDSENVTYICKNTAGNIKIDSSKAEGNIHAAPLSAGKSGYPHQFTNQGKIKFPNNKCNNLAHGTILLEFPVFADGHLYAWDAKPKPDPGPVRAIYTNPSKDFCGVVAHTEGNQGPLELCTK